MSLYDRLVKMFNDFNGFYYVISLMIAKSLKSLGFQTPNTLIVSHFHTCPQGQILTVELSI